MSPRPQNEHAGQPRTSDVVRALARNLGITLRSVGRYFASFSSLVNFTTTVAPTIGDSGVPTRRRSTTSATHCAASLLRLVRFDTLTPSAMPLPRTKNRTETSPVLPVRPPFFCTHAAYL